MKRLALLACALLAGCSGSDGGAIGDGSSKSNTSHGNQPPVIDAVRMPTTPTRTEDGYLTVEGRIDYHDVDDGVQTIRISYDATPSGKLDFDYPAVEATRGVDVPIVVKFDPRTGSGPQSYRIVLIDHAGATASSAQTATLP